MIALLVTLFVASPVLSKEYEPRMEFKTYEMTECFETHTIYHVGDAVIVIRNDKIECKAELVTYK